jgi:serine/threonine protein phosphatase PrpC
MSGTCANVTLIVDDMCYVVNLGDSRAIMSCGGGRYYTPLSADHKPSNPDENERVIEAGGRIVE